MLRTRLPLRIATAFDLHVLGLPPAFVLSQDQTLKLKSCDSGRLGGSHSKDHCVTGTFTAERINSGFPEHTRSGDGMKRSFRQSLV